MVRTGKGAQDRITVLPERSRQALMEQIEAVRRLHQEDMAQGLGAVYLPFALERKYPNEKREFGWQWLFPARNMSRDPRSGERRRHHVSEDYDARNQKPIEIRNSKGSLVRPTSRPDRPGRNRASSHIATNGDMATRQSLTADPASGAG